MNTLNHSKWSWIILSKAGVLKMYLQNNKTFKNYKRSLTYMPHSVI